MGPPRGRCRSSTQSLAAKIDDGGSTIFEVEERRWGEFFDLQGRKSKIEDGGFFDLPAPKIEDGGFFDLRGR